MRASSSLLRLLLGAGLLWATARHFCVPATTFTGASADRGSTRPEDFLRRNLVDVAINRKVLESDLALLKQRASEGMRSTSAGFFRIAFDMQSRFFRVVGNMLYLTANVNEAATLNDLPKYSFQAVDDPMIIVRNETGHVIKMHHYLGPAVVIFFDEKGDLKHIDFVGVCNFWGGDRQGRRADYVGEHARLYVRTGQWRYRDECGRHTAEVSECDWASEKRADWQPQVKWLQPFRHGKTFVLHTFQPRVIKGPPFIAIWRMAVAPELYTLDFDRSKAREWMNAILCVVGAAQLNNMKEKAEELLLYAIMYGMAMANAGQQLAALSGR